MEISFGDNSYIITITSYIATLDQQSFVKIQRRAGLYDAP